MGVRAGLGGQASGCFMSKGDEHSSIDDRCHRELACFFCLVL